MLNKIPITIGVIGHLDATVTDEHFSSFSKILDDINVKFPNSPVTLFSQLAKGADMAFSNEFIKIKKSSNRNYELIVPLPFSEIEYLKSLSNNERKDYNLLKREAKISFVLDTTVDITDSAYQKGGQFIADSSIILIALFDGDYNGKKGGTADIIKYKIKGSFQDDVEQTIFDTNGSLIILPCSRTNKGTSNKSIENSLLEKLLQEDSNIKKALDKIEYINKNSIYLNSATFETVSNDIDFSKDSLPTATSELKSYFSIINSIAKTQQHEYRYALNFFFILGVLILGSFESYKHLGLHLWLFFVTIGLISIAFIVYKKKHHDNNHTKYLEDRVLSEALRIQFFWNLCDLNKSVSDYILKIHKKEFLWIKNVLSSIYGLSYSYNNLSGIDESQKNSWISSQKTYFFDAIEKMKRTKYIFKKLSKLFFWTALILLIGIATLHYLHVNEFIVHLVIVINSILFGLFALSKAYYDKMGFDQIMNQYKLMHEIYCVTELKFQEINKSNNSRIEKNRQLDRLLYLAGKEALIEIGNWYLIFKEKEPEVEGLGG